MKLSSEADLSNSYFRLSALMIPLMLTVVLLVANYFSYLLFHVLAEFFAIVIAILMSVVAWQMYPFTKNNFLLYLGCGYFWIGLLDMLHTLSYKGMNVFPDTGINIAVQFWIGTRYLEAMLLLSAPWFLNHSLNRNYILLLYGFMAVAIALSVKAGLFPVGFVEGEGLTAFKVYSEYVIIIMLAGSIYYLNKNKKLMAQSIAHVMIVSIGLTMCAELAFTFYVDLYGLSNIVGHVFKLFSFWLIFMAVVKTTLQEPFLVMSRGATTYDAIPDATIVVDENGIIRQVNNKACLLSLLGCDELVGKNNHDVFHPENLNVEDCPVCQAIVTNNELSGYELKIDDAGNWYDFTLSHISGASHLDGTVEVIRDVTQRKLAEEKIKELDILKNSIVENLPLMLFVKDARDEKEHRYVEWNKAAEEISGILKEEILGNSDYDFWPKEQAEFFIDKDNDVMGSGQLLNIEQEPLTTKYKGVRTLHTKKIPIFDAEGKAKYLLGISEDITEKLKTESMLQRSEKMDAVGQMSGGIAHDFNNQLGVILGYTDLLLEQTLPDSQLKWVDAVSTAANRCADLTRQLLIFSRNGEVDKNIVNVNSVLSGMEILIERSVTPIINVKYCMAESLWQVDVNEGGITDAILNLVLNARDAMPDGGTLTIEATNIILSDSGVVSLPNISAGEYVEIMISDTGKGMSQEVYEHVFEPFFTTKEVGKGTGLGLSMVYGFVRRYGGDLSLETKPDEGATFRIYLPRAVDKNKEALKPSREIESYPEGHESILVVDDEDALLIYAEEVLKGWGYKVFCAKNADEALLILGKSQIDLLFSDVVMPGSMNGYALAEAAVKKYPKLKVLITSGFADKFAGEDYTKYGFELISKPYSRDSLAKTLRQILDE